MKRFQTALKITTAVVLPFILQGCSTNLLPGIASASKATDAADTLTSPKVSGSPVKVYSQVAKGANQCWFKRRKPVLKGYIFHASAASDRSHAVITIHEIGPDKKRGMNAFSIEMQASGDDATIIAVANHRLSAALGKRLEMDVQRWASGGSGCKNHRAKNSKMARLLPTPIPSPAPRRAKVKAPATAPANPPLLRGATQ